MLGSRKGNHCDEYAEKIRAIANEIILVLREKELSLSEVGSVLHQIWATLREREIQNVTVNREITAIEGIALETISLMKRENLNHHQVESVLVDIEAFLGGNKV